MKIKKQLLLIILFFGFNNTFSQETILNLKEAIDLAINKSSESVLANTKIETKKLEYEVVTNIQYPDFKISGQYLRLAGAKVELKNSNPKAGGSPDVNELIIGQANLNMPLFSGFKIQNSIKANENIYKAEQSKSLQTKEEIAIKVVDYYANLYRA